VSPAGWPPARRLEFTSTAVQLVLPFGPMSASVSLREDVAGHHAAPE
jgi:hypothetical protein